MSIGNKRNMAYDLEGLTAVSGIEGAGRQALVYLGAAPALREQIGAPLPPSERAILDRILAPARAGLATAEREGAQRRGRNRRLPAAIEQALRMPSQWPEKGYTSKYSSNSCGVGRSRTASSSRVRL